MPLPGYLGYLLFALEGAAVLALLDRLRALWPRRGALGALGALLVAHVALEVTAFPRSTLSHSPLALPGDPPELRRLARVAHLGRANAEKLRRAGVASVEDLAAADPARLPAIAPQPVLRLWKRAAERELR
jgi:hypothetical protein